MLNKCHFYTAWASKPIIIYSDCQGLKQNQSRDIADIDNRRLFKIKSDLMTYNYEIRHVKGEAKCIADCLSRCPTWLVEKDKKSDNDQDPILTRCSDNRAEFCLSVIIEARHIPKDNPALAALEEMGKKDPDYCHIIEFIWTKQSFIELPY